MAQWILVVDDELELRQELDDALSEEYDVVQAAHGQEALAILHRPHRIEAVILDVMLPGASGTDVLRQIKELDPALGIIIMTGHSSKEVAIDALKGHADEYIEKPVNPAKVREALRSVLAAKDMPVRRQSADTKGKIAQVQEFLKRNCHKKVSLRDVAGDVCLSPKYLSRIFEEQTGMRFTVYRLKLKISRAKELLCKTGYNIDQISDTLGYRNTESFIRQFKKLAKATPTAFRKKAKAAVRRRR
jgi:YesN/AraC family two-component response regulator